MFIYMRALKCHPAIEQSGQAKSMRRRAIQLWSQMVKGPWHTSYLSSFLHSHILMVRVLGASHICPLFLHSHILMAKGPWWTEQKVAHQVRH